MNLFAFFRRPKPAPTPPRIDPGEMMILRKAGHTPETWARLTNQERATIRWRYKP